MRRDVFQAIADPTRRNILVKLSKEALTPNSLAENFHTSRQAISKHIRILTECGLLRKKPEGREIYYYFQPRKLREVEKWLEPFKKQWNNRFDQLDDVLSHLKNK